MSTQSKNVKKITLSLPDELDKRLRDHAESEYSGIKGSLSIIASRALDEYLKKQTAAR
jgi:predicted transcriptional regulator